MKNIHILPTDKPSRLFYNVGGALLFTNYENHNGVNIYITSDEEIKEGDWIISIEGIWKNIITKVTGEPIADVWRKIIMTDNADLIKDGVQAIDDEFLEWFVNNSSCEFVEVEHSYVAIKVGKSSPKVYKIIIPKEEPKQEYSSDLIDSVRYGLGLKINLKQETLEEVAKNYAKGLDRNSAEDFINGAKWQQQQNKNLYIELAERIANEYEFSYMTDDGIQTSKLKKEKVLKIANDYINELNLQSSK